jgi:hypothetical protein
MQSYLERQEVTITQIHGREDAAVDAELGSKGFSLVEVVGGRDTDSADVN